MNNILKKIFKKAERHLVKSYVEQEEGYDDPVPEGFQPLVPEELEPEITLDQPQQQPQAPSQIPYQEQVSTSIESEITS